MQWGGVIYVSGFKINGAAGIHMSSAEYVIRVIWALVNHADMALMIKKTNKPTQKILVHAHTDISTFLTLHRESEHCLKSVIFGVYSVYL